MRIRALNRLSAVKVRALKEPGVHADGGGLRLLVDDHGGKSWSLQLTLNGKRTTRRLGSYPEVCLEEAREHAAAISKGAKVGVDVKAEAARKARSMTFREMFDIVLEHRLPRMSNAKARAQWTSTMET